MPPATYVFAAGGTGGHLYPGIAIWRAIQSLDPAARAIFLCSDRPIDDRILSEEGVEFRPTPARPFGLRPRQFVQFLGSWGKTVRFGRQVLRQARQAAGHVHVVALGGFVAAPIVQAARLENVPTTMLNIDAVPGKANRLIARRIASAPPPHNAGIYTAIRIPASHTYARDWQLVPPIVRPAAVARGTRAECRQRLGLHPDRPTLMVTGGSLGASTINQFLLNFARSRPQALRGWQILHQTGEKSGTSTLAADLHEAYAAANGLDANAAIITSFVADIGDWWGAADLAISRAGAGAVAEAWANTVPALFLPYPYHKDEHQRHNAALLEQAGGAIIATDHINPAANLNNIAPTLNSLLQDPARRATMQAALTRLGPANGAEVLAQTLVQRPTRSGDQRQPEHPNHDFQHRGRQQSREHA